jgi:hypothetical protein
MGGIDVDALRSEDLCYVKKEVNYRIVSTNRGLTLYK